MSEEIRLNVSADTTQMERNITEATRRVGTITLNANIDTRSLDQFSRPLGRITGQADEFTKSMEAANARVLAFGASVGTINLISSAFKNLIASTNEVEESLTQIKTVGGETFANLKEVSSGIFDIAKKTGTSFKDASEATLEFSRQGKSLKDSLESANAALILTRTTGLDAAESVKGLTTAVNVFNESGLTMAQIVNKLAAVDTAFAVGSRDLIEGISRSASVAQEAGVSFDELAAFITVLQEKTGRGGAVIGNALKTIFTRVQNPEILKDIQKLGIAVTDASGDILPATQIIKGLAMQFDGLDKNLRNNLLLKVGGGFQVDKLAALLNDVALANGKFSSSLNTSASATDQADKKVKQLNQTLTASAANLGSAFKELGSNIGAIGFSKDFTDYINIIGSGLSSLNKSIFGSGDGEDQGNKFAQAFIKGFGSIVSGPVLAVGIGLLVKGIIEFTKFIGSAALTQLNISTKAKEEALIREQISKSLANNVEFQRELFSLGGSQVDKAERLLNIYKNQAAETKKIADFSKSVAPMLYQSGVRMGSGNVEVKGSNTAAGGYIPNLASAISKEKSESPQGSKIIVDHSFPMGGGQKGTMVYNSNETRISNFNGSGGDAIIPNYPISAALGYTPNFAKKEKKEKKGGDQNKVLNFDASNESVAGLTLGNDFGNVLTKAKPYQLSNDVLKKYAGSPYLDVLNEFDTFNVTNLPVGNIYKFRKGLNEKEEKIKGDFVARLNSQFRSEIINFILAEVSNLGLKPGGGLAANLSNLKLDILGPSTAGYIFEEVLKIPTLTDAEKVAQYSNQSSTDFFDIKNLDPNFAEAYGLPKKKFDFAEIKLGQKELMSGIPKKVLNQLILEGGGANPSKFGKAKRAASGYIPNFALIKNLAKIKDIGASYLPSHYDVDNAIGGVKYNDKYKGNAKIKKFKLARPLASYTKEIEDLLENFKNTGERTRLDYLKNTYTQKSFDGYKTAKTEDSKKGYVNVLKGALGEEEVFNSLKTYIQETNNFAGIDFYSPDKKKLVEIKTKEKPLTQDEANAKVLTFLGTKDPLKGNEVSDERNLSDTDFNSWEVERPKTKYLNASKGYVPNFAYDLGINKDNIAIRSVTSPFDEKGNRIRGTGAVKEAILAAIEKAKAKGFTKITADAISDASVNAFTKQFGRAVKGKNSWDISEFKNAASGYIPNFASSIEDAISREKAATGLPDSMIKVSKDSRAKNSYLNPSGTIVTNKIDEPRGGIDVPNSRMVNAYNSAKGFVPNFAFGDEFIRGAKKSGATQESIDKAIAGARITVSQDVVKAEENLVKETVQLTESVSKRKKRADKLAEAEKKQAEDLQKKGTSSTFPQTAFDIAANKDVVTKAIQNKTLKNITYSSGENTGERTGFDYSNNASYNKDFGYKTPNYKTPETKAYKQEAFSVNRSFDPVPIPRIPIPYATQAPVEKKPLEAKLINEVTEKKQNEKGRETSATDLAAKLLIAQSALSFVTGAMSSFGKEMETAAGLVSTFAQGLFVVSQGTDALKMLTGGKGIAKVLGGAVSGASDKGLQLAAEKALGPTQMAFNKLNNITVAADTGIGSRVGGFVRGGGGIGAVAGASFGVLAGTAIAAGLAFKGLDSILKLQAGSATKTGDAIAKMTELQNKYGVALNESQKSVVDSIKELSSVDAAGLKGFDVGNIGRSISKFFGGKDETYKSELRNELRKTGLMEGGNEALASTLSSTLTPIISERLRAEKGGKAPTQSELTKAVTQETTKILNERITGKVDEDIKNEIRNRLSSSDLKSTTFFRGAEYVSPELKEKRAKAIKEIEATRTSRIEAETEEAIKSESPESKQAQRTAEVRQAKILLQTDLLNKQLDVTLQIIKAEGQIPSFQESQLSIRRELLQLSSAERFESEIKLKQLQDERSLRNEINDLFLRESQGKISEYLKTSAASGVNPEIQAKVEQFQNQMSSASSAQEQMQAYKEVLQGVQYIKDANGQLNELDQNLITYLQKQADGLTRIANIKSQISAQDSLQKAIIDRNNAAINLQKDLFSASFSVQQREIESFQKKLDIQNKINDSLFKASNINLKNPNEDPFIAQRTEQLRNIQLPAQREMQAFDLEKRKAELSDRQSIFNAAMQKGASPDQLRRLSESKSLEDSYKILGQVLSEQGNNFTKNVEVAGKYFYESMIGTAETVRKILTEEYVAEDGKLYNKKELEKFKTQQNQGTNVAPFEDALPINSNSFISDATTRLMQSLDKKYQIESEVKPLTPEEIRRLNPSQSDQLVSPKGAINAGIAERTAEFNNSIAKKYWDLDKQRLENSITLAQRALDIEKQRVAEQLKLEQTKFEGRNALEFNPLKQQLNQADFQRQSQIKAAKIEDEQNQRNYLLEARKSALNYMISSGAAPKNIESVQNMTSIKEIQDALNKVAEANVIKVGTTPEERWNNGVDQSIEAWNKGVVESIGKIISGNPQGIDGKVGMYTDTSTLPTDITELKKRKEYLSSPNTYDDASFEEAQKIPEALKRINEALDKAVKEQEDRVELAKKGIYTSGILPQAPYLKTPGTISQTSAETNNRLEEIKNQTLFSRGLSQSKGGMESELMTFQNRLAKQIPTDFRDSMTAAFKELASGDSTTPLKDRLMGVASAFLQKISDAMMNNVATGLTNSLMGGLGISSSGGGSSIFGMASGGKISGGSGNKDDVPAMLMGGEFVIKKSSAQKYGTEFLDALNQGKISKYANGGMVFDEFSLNKSNYEQYSKASRFTDFQDQGLSFNKEGAVTNIQDYSGSEADKGNELMRRQTQYYQATQQTGKDGFFAPGKFGTGAIVGQKNLLSFATQQAASSKYDKISGGKDSASIDLAGGSENLTTAALNDDINIKNKEFEEAKQKAQDLYINGQIGNNERVKMDYDNEKAYQEQLRKYEEQKKAQRRQMWINAAMIVGTAALGSMGGAGGIAKMFLGSKAASSGTQYLTGAVEGSTLIDAGSMGASAAADMPTYAWMGGKPSLLDKALAYSGRRKYAEGGLVTNNYTNSNKEVKNNSSDENTSYSDYRNMSSIQDVKNNSLLNNIFKNVSLYNKVDNNTSSSNYNELSSIQDVKNNSLLSEVFKNVSLYNKVDKNISSYNTQNAGLNKSENDTSNINRNTFSSSNNSNIFNNSISKDLNRLRFSRFASGGVVNGNGYGDNVPSLLTGGEFVVNKDSAKKIGYSNLNNLNSGNSNSNSNREVDFSKMEERLDKLISTLTENKETPNITITVNSDKSEQENSSKQNSDKDLARRIKQSVLQILADEKRLGGSLR
jgi:hypothetical protein